MDTKKLTSSEPIVYCRNKKSKLCQAKKQDLELKKQKLTKAFEQVNALGNALKSCKQKSCGSQLTALQKEKENALKHSSKKDYTEQVRKLREAVMKSKAAYNLYQCSIQNCEKETRKSLEVMKDIAFLMCQEEMSDFCRMYNIIQSILAKKTITPTDYEKIQMILVNGP